MATFNERFEMTKLFLADKSVTPREGFVHLYYWLRFEHAILIRDRANIRAEKYSRKLNENLDVYNFRKSMSDL